MLTEFKNEFQLKVEEENKSKALQSDIQSGLSEFHSWFRKMNDVYKEASDLNGDREHIIHCLQKLEVS